MISVFFFFLGSDSGLRTVWIWNELNSLKKSSDNSVACFEFYFEKLSFLCTLPDHSSSSSSTMWIFSCGNSGARKDPKVWPTRSNTSLPPPPPSFSAPVIYYKRHRDRSVVCSRRETSGPLKPGASLTGSHVDLCRNLLCFLLLLLIQMFVAAAF